MLTEPRPVSPETEAFPTSLAQRGMWFLWRLAPGSAFYNVPLALALKGALDTGALERALAEVVRRHGVLRTTYREGPAGAPVQLVHTPAPVPMPVADLRRRAATERAAELARLAQAEYERPFDLEAGPVLRAQLVRSAESASTLLLTLHHVACDGWGANVLMQELRVLYRAFAQGRPSPLPELEHQYSDFAQAQADGFGGAAENRQLEWWRQRLAGAPTALDLPTDRPRPAVQTFRGARMDVPLPTALARQLRALARAHNATLFMTLLAALDVLLARYTRRQDVVVGAFVAGRGRTELEGLVGHFANTVLLRTDLADDPTFAELLGRVRHDALDAFAHQDVRVEALVRELAPDRDPTRMPLCQVVLSHLNFKGAARPEGGVDVRRSATKYDLVVHVNAAAADAGLTLAAEYSSDLFDESTIARLLGHYRALLEAAVAHPAQRVSRLSMLGRDERQRVLVDWAQDPPVPYPADRRLHELFSEQATRTPAAIALIDGRDRITYRDLEARANRLAHHLRARGAGRETPVAVCLERSPALVVALLGVLKAGAAYVPLDAAYPPARLAHMLESSAAPLLVTTAELGEQLPETGARRVLLDRDRRAIARRPGTPPAVPGAGTDLAYLIYTSGSTGEPKGVMGTHRGMVNRFHWMWRTFPFQPGEICCQKTALSFVDSIWEIFGPLLRGVPSVLVPNDAAREPRALIAMLAAGRVSRLVAVPSLLRMLLDTEPDLGAALPCLCLVVTSGEALPADLAQRLLRVLPGARLLNLYGSSEVAADATWHEVTAGEPEGPVPIGRPIFNVRVRLLDEALQPVPIGVAGEVYIGGDALARGYWKRPDLTAERFLSDPYGEGLLYRTGDLARHRRDGVLVYLGRADHQVKVRGMRVELGEVEAAIKGHPGVEEAVVVAREHGPGDTRLLAYVVPRTVAVEDLRRTLAARLPDYMHPAAYLPLDALPLTPNGKLDRRALPEPPAVSTRAYVAPRNREEAALATIFAGVLGVERVGVHDGFFALGGHSLSATQVAARARDALEVEIPLRLIFERPTVAELAAALAGLEHGVHPEPIAPAPGMAADWQPLSFAQRRLWFLDQLTPGSAAYTIPTTYRYRGRLDEAALRRAIGWLVQRHAALRTTFHETATGPLQKVASEQELEIPVADLRTLAELEREGEARRLTGELYRRPFDLGRGPLIRALVVRLADEDTLLFVAVHHIVSDGWSMQVLDIELRAAYAAYRTGAEPPLPPLPLQYGDYAAWQRRWLDGEAMERELEHWRSRLAGAPGSLDLPTDRPRPPAQSFHGARMAMVLPRELAGHLRELAQGAEATLFMVLLAAYKVLLKRYSGQDDVLVGIPVAGRGRPELAGLIGLFVNTLVLRTDLSGAPPFIEVVRRVREQTLDALDHQELPFERLVEEVAPVRDLSRSPLFQVMFVMQNTREPVLQALEQQALQAEPGDLRRIHWAVEGVEAKFDLTLTAAEQPNGIRLTLEYSTDIFDTATARRLLRHYRRLLEAAVEDPACGIEALPLMGPGERRRMLVDWNQTGAPLAVDRCLHEVFAERARRTPEAVAVEHEGAALTYAELDAASAAWARRLAALGVRRGSLVGICLERTPELAVGLLAVLRAGAGYVPMDPGFPSARLRFMAEDAACPVVLTRSDCAPDLPGIPVLALDGPAPAAESAPEAALPSDVAYAIYTSGSTGQPKGVLVEHRQVMGYVLGMAQRVGWAPGAGYAMLQPLTVDSSVTVLWGALLGGGRLHLVSRQRAADAAALAGYFERHPIDYLKIAPSHLAALQKALPDRPQAVLPRRWLVIGGEASQWEWVKRLPALTPGLRVFNHYGPTETTVGVLTYDVNGREEERHGVSPLGRPLPNVTAYILDPCGEPVPVGVPGELWLGGAGIARGYLNRPQLTAERFTADPLAPGGRRYRTGDLARWSPEGVVEFLGRLDHQVKIRGFRIELGEVQAMLARHPAVGDAVVLARGEDDEKRLVAWFATRTGVGLGQAVDLDELRSWLREQLPDYMVPAALVPLDALPLTPHGKVDLQALPEPPADAQEEEYAPPSSATEATLAEIWSEVLGRDRVGVRTNFFDLGGHSLLATQVVARARDRLGVEVPLRALFEHPTVAGLADALGRGAT